MIRLKRAYEKSSDKDGMRILVERLWPRGLTKARAAVDLWIKDVAPSPDLRKWFGHDPARWKQFKQRYWKELKNKTEDIDVLRRKAKEGQVTFIYAAHDKEHNGALALKEFIEQRGNEWLDGLEPAIHLTARTSLRRHLQNKQSKTDCSLLNSGDGHA